MGLNDKLKSATSATEVENLLAEGTKFPNASPKTCRRWKSVATRRLRQLQGVVEKQTIVEHKAEVEESKAEKPRNKYRQKKVAIAS